MHTLIDDNTDSYGGNISSALACIPQTTTTLTSPPNDGSIQGFINIGTTSVVLIVTLLAFITILLIIITVRWKKWKKQKQIIINADDTTYSNPINNSKLVSWPIVYSFEIAPWLLPASWNHTP